MQDTSKKLLDRASLVIPAGVNSPVRAWRAVGGDPRFIVRGRGANIWDADGNEYIDLVNAWGPLIAGHAHPDVVQAVSHASKKGTGFGAPTTTEIEVAELITEAFPSIDKVRLVTSGTEATMTALRLARAATDRSRVIKMAGCYHGHSDPLLVRAGSGAATFGVPDSAGVPNHISALTSVAEFNDLDSLAASLALDPPPAAVILEPVAANMGVVPPAPGYLEKVIEMAHDAGALVVFDEVITGFRVARGGAQELYGVQADITCLGKIIGGGLPVGAVGGSAELMEQLAPLGPVYQAGTLAGNPIACAAGRETLRLLTEDVYAGLEERGAQLESGVREAIQKTGVNASVQRVGSLSTVFFGVDGVHTYADAQKTDTDVFGAFFRAMIDRGINVAPSQFEAWFLSIAHGSIEVDQIVTATLESLEQVASGG